MKLQIAFLAALIAASPTWSQSPEKRKVAVLDFQYGTVMTEVQAVFGTNKDIGRGISDLVVDRLINDGKFRVIERRDLDKVLGEQNFSNSDRADSNTAAKIGRVLGVDAIIVGDITQFGRDDHNTGLGGAFGHWDKYGIGNVGMRKAKAAVGITARLVDVNTGEILASVTGKGESARSGTNLLGGGAGNGTGGAASADMSSSNFSQTIIGEAVWQAVQQMASQLDDNAGKLPEKSIDLKGIVADASGGTVTINIGTRAGVRVGDKLAVSHVSRIIKDPATGKPLRSVEEALGTLQITSVDDGSAVGTFIGSQPAQVGDTVKSGH